MAGADVERQREGMVADIRRVVAGGAGSIDLRRIAERRVVVQSANAGDMQRRGVEEHFACGDLGLVVVVRQ